MTIGVTIPASDTYAAANLVDEFVVQTREAADAGLSSVWFPQLLDYDAVTVAAVAGREIPGISVGTGVVPLYPRHPLLVSALAQTAQAATGGRFTLGLGLGAKPFLEPVFGQPFPPQIEHLREYLTVLRPLVSGEETEFDGETVSLHPSMPTAVPGAKPVPIVVAAMGPRALAVAGELADGTLPYLAGPKALSTSVVPVIGRAAESAGRPAPKVIAVFPAVVTGEVEATRELLAERLAVYDTIPSYQRILAAEGVSRAAELAVIGDEQTIAAAVGRYFDAGATEVVISQAGVRSSEDRLRTWKLLGELNKR
ncbi:F420-dependent oxidoreductase, MSMEG_4879 family [Amycolatopsis xylanica]|uniref:F420-dependent oxidoreductase, MSMEG_4879 family n=1 Tax=Amycolatopsis xylanica TaxID=589385 RepID=A0A1H3A1J8_9PSEU|nr:TIGR03564 family F420-dependent LLM class oxidoreductase [Amycolatopsis xylanica]SDX23098.1 F420-dependent oxidoreductase, MSMEG_4879 family [Amycolatopsis xylanica]